MNNTMKLLSIRLLLCIHALFALSIAGYAQVASSTTAETALADYLNKHDAAYRWEVKEHFIQDGADVYSLLLTSQQWREHIWLHQLSIIVPKELKQDGALLFITGGGLDKQGQPKWSGEGDALTQSFALIANKNKAIVAVLKQTPNQPLYDNLVEDALISYTLHNFKKDHDYTWPLLFPMVKSAKRAMDAVQEFATQKLQKQVTRFVVSGASKRGWTTWLTGANDSRVVAIAPMVIDMLKMPVSVNYQIETWGDYSIQIQDYVKLGIVQEIDGNSGKEIVQMIDPYSYRKQLTMPKMIFMGTNDEYWPVDNIKNYYDSLPGQNFIHYIPNAGHSMGDKKEVMANLSSFFGLTLANAAYPVCNWTSSVTKKGVKVKIKATGKQLVDVVLWSANSPDRDLRNDAWTSKSLNLKNKSTLVVEDAFPASGYRAFYVNLIYKNEQGELLTESTRVFLMDDKSLL